MFPVEFRCVGWLSLGMTKGFKGQAEVRGGGSGAILKLTELWGNCFYLLKFRTCASC